MEDLTGLLAFSFSLHFGGSLSERMIREILYSTKILLQIWFKDYISLFTIPLCPVFKHQRLLIQIERLRGCFSSAFSCLLSFSTSSLTFAISETSLKWTNVLFVLLFIRPFVCLFIYPSVLPFVCPSVCLFVHPPIQSFVRLSVSICPFVRPSVHSSVSPFVRLFIRPFVHLSVCPFVYSSVLFSPWSLVMISWWLTMTMTRFWTF